MYSKIKQELIERYEQTGKIGFSKPATREEAYQLIETLSNLCESNTEPEIVTLSLTQLTDKLREFFKNF